jgi:hypothetical protein
LAYRTLNANLKAILLADSGIKALVGLRVFLGQAREGNALPLIWWEYQEPASHRTETIVEDPTVVFHCEAADGDTADLTAAAVKAILDPQSAQHLFDLDGAGVGGVLRLDYTLGVSQVRDPQAALVYDGVVRYRFHVTRQRPA